MTARAIRADKLKFHTGRNAAFSAELFTFGLCGMASSAGRDLAVTSFEPNPTHPFFPAISMAGTLGEPAKAGTPYGGNNTNNTLTLNRYEC